MSKRKSMTIEELKKSLYQLGYAKIRNHHILFAPILQTRIRYKNVNNVFSIDHLIDNWYTIMNDIFESKLLKSDRVDIILSIQELNPKFLEFINSLRGRCKRLVIYNYINMSNKDLISILKDYINFDDVETIHRHGNISYTTMHRWIGVCYQFDSLIIGSIGDHTTAIFDIDMTLLDDYPIYHITFNNTNIEYAFLPNNYIKNNKDFIDKYPIIKETIINNFSFKQFHCHNNITTNNLKTNDDIWNYITQSNE